MKTKIAVLADYASVSEGGKLNILGIFSNIMARTAPITHAQMHLVVQFEFDFSEAGQKDFRVRLMDLDGKEIVNLAGQLQIPQPSGFETANINQIFVFNNTTFPQFGEYVFEVLVDDAIKAEIPVRVMQMKEG
ncbi:MAG: hypothetical protein HY327_01660 [Chloroflexi bacterium]|nr:hypothetical protein [Chloroflexota bacterium]